jgi:hypothetical protein
LTNRLVRSIVGGVTGCQGEGGIRRWGAAPDVLEAAIIPDELSRAGLAPGIMTRGISMLVPTPGEHTGEVLGRLLGYDAARLDALRRAGAIA